MKITKLFLIAIAGSAFFASCNSDDSSSAPLGAYDNGVLVLNEGNASAGSVTFIGEDMATVSQNIYSAENEGDGIGGYVQSIFFNGDKAYIISNGSNKITIVNRYTFELIDKIETGFDVPRYGVVVNGKAYVTNLASFMDEADDFISVINLSTNEVESTIAVNAIADKITEENGKLYVANGNYGAGSSVTLIDPATSSIVTKIETGNSPNSFEEENNVLYVLCSNYVASTKLVKISLTNNQVLSEITFPESLRNAQNLNIEDGKIYFTVDAKVFSLALDATTVSETPLFTSGATTLYGFAVEDNKIFVADAKDFNSAGQVFVYSTTGTLQKDFTVGLIPNGFYFND